MRKVYEAPKMDCQEFTANEYIAACHGEAVDEDGNALGMTVYWETASIRHETAFRREDISGTPTVPMDDTIYDPRPIYMGSFYYDDALTDKIKPDATGGGHEYQELNQNIPCVQGNASRSPWGYHYHLINVTNLS